MSTTKPRATLRRFSEIPAKRLRFAWEGRLVAYGVNAIVGIGGRGKSQVTVRLGADLSNGLLAGDFKGKKVAVLIASAEDPSEQVIRPRLEAAGANLDRVFELRIEGGGDDPDRLLNLPDDVEAIGDAVRGLREEEGFEEVVVFVDPFKAHLTLKANTNQEHHMRHVLAALQGMAERTESSIVLVDHPNKKSDALDLATRMSGAGTYNAIRSALVFGKDPEAPDGDTRLLATAKSNWAEAPEALRFKVIPDIITDDRGDIINTVRLDWEDVAHGLTYEDILEAEGVTKGQGNRKWSKTAAAEFYILGRTFGTRVLAGDVIAEAATFAGCVPKTVNRASNSLVDQGRLAKDEDPKGVWYWSGVEEPEESEDAPF